LENKGTTITEQDLLDAFELLMKVEYKQEVLTPQQIWDRYYKNLPLFDTNEQTNNYTTL